MADDNRVLDTISELVEREKDLRARIAGNTGTGPDEVRELQAVEVQLDQCWDLLRQRRAKRETHEDPDEAQVRPSGEVEGYLQ